MNIVCIEEKGIVDVEDKAYEIIRTSNDDEATVLRATNKCLIGFHPENFERDSKIVLSIYKDKMSELSKNDEIACVDDIVEELMSKNFSVCRAAAEYIYLNDDNLMCEAHHLALNQCKRVGIIPDDNSEYFSEIYSDSEFEVIDSVAADLFNEYSFTISRDLNELVVESLDSFNCIYMPSKILHSRCYYDIYMEGKEFEIIPILNDSQELLIPELSSIKEHMDDVRYMRIGSGVSC